MEDPLFEVELKVAFNNWAFGQMIDRKHPKKITINKNCNIGKTEAPIAKAVQCGHTMATLDNFFGYLGLYRPDYEGLNKYMDELKSKYPNWRNSEVNCG